MSIGKTRGFLEAIKKGFDSFNYMAFCARWEWNEKN